MHLAEVLRLRPVPAAAVLFGLTRRCPLSCAHCSTRSSLAAEEPAAADLLRFAGTFTPHDHPELVVLSGGEPLLRPRLVRAVAERSRAAGTRSYLLTGMFFARRRTVPRAVRDALDAVDHVAVSMDAYHDREVPRAAVLRALRELSGRGKGVSVQVVGVGDEDPQVAALVASVRAATGDRVPVLVGRVAPVGRAAAWLRPPAHPEPLPRGPLPCPLAAWPVVTFDGTVVACCNQQVVDGGVAAPPHLRLGSVATDPWPVIRRRCLDAPVLRGLRTLGPERLGAILGRESRGGACATCRSFPAGAAGDPRLRAVMDRPGMRALEPQVQREQERRGAVGFAGRYGVRRYAELVLLGETPPEGEACGG